MKAGLLFEWLGREFGQDMIIIALKLIMVDASRFRVSDGKSERN